MKKLFENRNINRYFALELPLERSIQVFIVATFFVFACNATSIGCCNPSDSRPFALLTVPRQGVQQSFFVNTFFIRQLERSVKNEELENNSTHTSRETCDSGILKPSYRGKYIYLKGRYNRSLREISELKAEVSSYSALLEQCQKQLGRERQLRELFQREINCYMGLTFKRIQK